MSRLTFSPLPLPATADSTRLEGFGRLVRGYDPETATDAELQEIQRELYEHDLLLFEACEISPKKQFELTQSFDPDAGVSALNGRLG